MKSHFWNVTSASQGYCLATSQCIKIDHKIIIGSLSLFIDSSPFDFKNCIYKYEDLFYFPFFFIIWKIINSITNMSKSVRFNPIDTIIITYSADEYDRSCFASVIPTSYTFRPSTIPATVTAQVVTLPQSRPVIKPLDLSMIPNSRRRVLDSPIIPNDMTMKKLSNKKPRLSINTQSLTPLFFSGLSTHYKCKDGEEEEHGYLIPVMSC